MVVRPLARHHRLRVVVQGKPELVPGWAFAVAAGHSVNLLQGGVCELENIDHAHNLAGVVHNGEVEVMSV